MNAVHTQKAELFVCNARVFAGNSRVAKNQAGIVRRHQAIGESGGSDLGFCAIDQLVLKLTGRTHGGGGYGTAMVADKIE